MSTGHRVIHEDPFTSDTVRPVNRFRVVQAVVPSARWDAAPYRPKISKVFTGYELADLMGAA